MCSKGVVEMECKKCGAELQNEDTFCAACGEDCQSAEKTAVKCIECGKFFDKEFGMCPFCGTELAEDNLQTIDNHDTPLSVTDAEEKFAEENTEGNFMLCPNCNNKYDINVGLCTICGYSSLETDETVAEEEASANVSAIEDSTSDKLQNAYNSAYNDTEENKPVNYKKIGIISAVVIGFIIVIALIVNANKLSGVSMNQIETDISELSVVTNGVIESEYTPFTPYTVDSVEIEKRQTNIDDKEDIVYCNIVISNEYYESELYYELIYYYYDDGGWILQRENCIEKFVRPIAAINKNGINEIRVKVNENTYTLTRSNVSNISFIDGSTPSSKIDYTYNDGFISFTGTVNCNFENEHWQSISSTDFELKDFSINWSSESIPKSYSPDTFNTIYPRKKYYRSAADKNREYHIYVATNNVYYTFTIDSIIDDTIKGKFNVTAINTSAIVGEDEFPTVKNNISKSFECKFTDIQKGTFEIPFTADLFSYHYMGGWFIDPCYTSANVKAKISYDFDESEWYVNLETVSLNLSSQAIIVE